MIPPPLIGLFSAAHPEKPAAESARFRFGAGRNLLHDHQPMITLPFQVFCDKKTVPLVLERIWQIHGRMSGCIFNKKFFIEFIKVSLYCEKK